MRIKLDEHNFVDLQLEFGGRISLLVLGGHTIIKAEQPYDDLGSGMFLMFPWISKVPQHPYSPELTNQYHGFVMNTLRSITILPSKPEQIHFQLAETHPIQNRHSFIQKYSLSKSKLALTFKVIPNQVDKLPYCFGFHPYLQIDNQHLDSIELKSDIKAQLAFDQNTLPVYPFVATEVEINSKNTYNNLFKGGSYIELISDKTHVKVVSDLPYWQIYNPPDRKTIAIQPASFCGNLYNIHAQDPNIILPQQANISFEVWEQ